MKAVSPSVGPSQCRCLFAKSGSAPDAKELEWQIELGPDAENATLCAKLNCHRGSVETLGPEKGEMVMLVQRVVNLSAYFETIRASAKTRRWQNMMLESDTCVKRTLYAMNFALVNILSSEL